MEHEDILSLRTRIHDLVDKLNSVNAKLILLEDRVETLRSTFVETSRSVKETDDRFHQLELVIDRLERSINSYNKVLWTTFIAMVGMFATRFIQ